MTVSVLCVAPRSHYYELPDLDLYDVNRDAYSFDGRGPVVCHPPCAQWSRLRALAHDKPREKALGPFCVEVLRANGGVLEHPASSKLFDYCGLPEPGRYRPDCWTASVDMSWWGFPTPKRTWLCFFGLSPFQVQMPLRLGKPRGRIELIHKPLRSRTPLEMCRDLVNWAACARS